MCVIDFNIVTTGTEPVAAEGRYRNIDVVDSNWITFTVNLLEQETPDIVINGNYEFQVRVQYPDTTWSDWTGSSLFTIGNCTQTGNLYAPLGESNCQDIVAGDFDTVLFSDNPDSGQACYSVEIGDILYKDSSLTIPADAGTYIMYGSFNGCFQERRGFTVNGTGMVIDNFFCA